jgi:RNA polymerase sigma factor (sigma-70 family)
MEQTGGLARQVPVVQHAYSDGGLRPIDPLLRTPITRATAVSIEDLYTRHYRRLWGLAAAVTLDRSIAAEVVHDAFAGLARRLHTVRNPEAYLHRSVVNLGIQVVRRRERQRRLPIAPIIHHDSPEIDELWKLVIALPPRQRAVVALRYWDDLSYEQIADALDVPLGSVKSTLHRALASLKDQIGEGR